MPHSHCARRLAARLRRSAHVYARIRTCPHCHQPMAALNLIVNISEKMNSERLVEAVRTRRILYESNTKSYTSCYRIEGHCRTEGHR